MAKSVHAEIEAIKMQQAELTRDQIAAWLREAEELLRSVQHQSENHPLVSPISVDLKRRIDAFLAERKDRDR